MSFVNLNMLEVRARTITSKRRIGSRSFKGMRKSIAMSIIQEYRKFEMNDTLKINRFRINRPHGR